MSTKSRAVRRATAALLASLIGLAGAPLVLPTAAVAEDCNVQSLSDSPSDKQWELRRLRPEAAWGMTKGRGVKVGVVDSGVSDDHPLLESRVLEGEGEDYVGNDPTEDCASHGTVIGGIIAAEYQEGSPFYGIAPEAQIVPFRVIVDSEKAGQDAETPGRIARGIRDAVKAGVKVINLSVRSPENDELAAAIADAVSKDVVIVAAAGNIGEKLPAGTTVYPAAYDGVIGVAAITPQGVRSDKSNYGNFVDIAAPGVQITSVAPKGGGIGVLKDGGTSFATAFVTGTAALVRSYYPNMSAPDVIERILATADSPAGNWDKYLGYGIVNPYQAVASLNGKLAHAPAALPAQTFTQPVPPADPLANLKVAASLSAAGAILLTIIILVGQAVRKHVRRDRPGGGSNGTGNGGGRGTPGKAVGRVTA
ncbi:type VII secretion-associated serine protease mycosin [Phytomonospora endophytica]|uniref:Type VII secretion-associated serine protease mycosin n=1 Tax=Phytomonospora endophytica TaxID=714109 RepID=A0A841FCW2_9ACTN|nr:type VII secretion-associated serine protease mycosin [Phytomonospora endophytica]MBB6032843.1 type VII secretion-associated serine protease mycosin [Phytomonospora endophytica]GIG65069.1 hypothetical protein Pen01_13640 [Phytomonospora endophytica]